MYTIKSLLTEIAGLDEKRILADSIFCIEMTRDLTLRTNLMRSPLNSFTFTLIKAGTCTISYNNRIIKLYNNDLFLYLPGLYIEVTEVSEDYEGICLFIDSEVVLNNIFSKDFLNASYFPLIHTKEPKITLEQLTFLRLQKKLEEIVYYLNSDNPLKVQASLLVFSLFLLDLFYSQTKVVPERTYYTKAERYAFEFLRLLPKNFKTEKNIEFYANKLNISKVYLSKIVKKVTGITVIENIERALVAEAQRLLLSTSMPVNEIALELGFADHPSFTKFFKRYKKYSPSKYRFM